MKKTVLALGIAGTLTLSGLSQAGTLSNADRDFLFGSQSVQAKTISVEEMKDTNGNWSWAGALFGAIAGGISYIAEISASNRKFSWIDFATYTVIGGSISGFFPVYSIEVGGAIIMSGYLKGSASGLYNRYKNRNNNYNSKVGNPTW